MGQPEPGCGDADIGAVPARFSVAAFGGWELRLRLLRRALVAARSEPHQPTLLGPGRRDALQILGALERELGRRMYDRLVGLGVV